MNIKGILTAFITGAVYTLGSIAMAKAVQTVSDPGKIAVMKEKFNNIKTKIFKRKESN